MNPMFEFVIIPTMSTLMLPLDATLCICHYIDTAHLLQIMYVNKSFCQLFGPAISKIFKEAMRDDGYNYLLSSTSASGEKIDVAEASLKLIALNRYYIFKKNTHIDITNPARVIGINSKINLGKILTPYLLTNLYCCPEYLPMMNISFLASSAVDKTNI